MYTLTYVCCINAFERDAEACLCAKMHMHTELTELCVHKVRKDGEAFASDPRAHGPWWQKFLVAVLCKTFLVNVVGEPSRAAS